MSDPRLDATESCIEALASGADIQQLITNYPELHPVLEAAAQANQLNIAGPPVDAQHRSRTRVLTYASQLRATPISTRGLITRLPRFALAVVIALFAFLAWSSLLIASARSLPGDQLYPVKRAAENFRLNLNSNSDNFQHIEEIYRERRIEEIRQLLDRQRSEFVSFDGQVNERGKRHWKIDSVPVIVAPETVILGQIEIGMLVEVEGMTQPEGWVQAFEIHLREFEVIGILEDFTEKEFVISGEEILINPNIHLDPRIQIGAQVQVVVQVDDDGTLHAMEIIFLDLFPPISPNLIPTATVPPTQMINPSPILTIDLDDDDTSEIDENDEEHDTELEEKEDETQNKDEESVEDEEEKDKSGDNGSEDDEGRKDD